jgi:hypothetical protein
VNCSAVLAQPLNSLHKGDASISMRTEAQQMSAFDDQCYGLLVRQRFQAMLPASSSWPVTA